MALKGYKYRARISPEASFQMLQVQTCEMRDF